LFKNKLQKRTSEDIREAATGGWEI